MQIKLSKVQGQQISKKSLKINSSYNNEFYKSHMYAFKNDYVNKKDSPISSNNKNSDLTHKSEVNLSKDIQIKNLNNSFLDDSCSNLSPKDGVTNNNLKGKLIRYLPSGQKK